MKRFKCDVCGAMVKALKRCCDGDYRLHRHGAIHTRLIDGSGNRLAYVLRSCAECMKEYRTIVM